MGVNTSYRFPWMWTWKKIYRYTIKSNIGRVHHDRSKLEIWVIANQISKFLKSLRWWEIVVILTLQIMNSTWKEGKVNDRHLNLKEVQNRNRNTAHGLGAVLKTWFSWKNRWLKHNQSTCKIKGPTKQLRQDCERADETTAKSDSALPWA